MTIYGSRNKKGRDEQKKMLQLIQAEDLRGV